MARLAALLAAVLLVAALDAQPAHPEFDVASLKPAIDTGRDLIQINLGRIRNGEVTLGNRLSATASASPTV